MPSTPRQQPSFVLESPPKPRPRRFGHAGRLRTGATAAQGAEGHRRGDCRGLRVGAGVRQVVAAPNGYLNFFLDRSLAFLRER
jgi:hypothetical protein